MTDSSAGGPHRSPNVEYPVVLAERYRLGPLIGLGGAAEVYRGLDLARDEPVAVKLFRTTIAGADDQRQQREIGTLTALHHPGLVTLRHAGVLGSRRYLVMDYVDGPSLRERLADGALPVPEVTRLGAALADALAYVHARGIVHRDVKPANVLLAGGVQARLVDFGLAQLTDATRVTATGYTAGTPAYLAPEQVRGAAVGPAADVYALGLVLLECVTGRCEYPGGPVEAAVARLHRRPEVPAHLERGLRGLLGEMTAPSPTARPGAAQVAAALRGERLDRGRTLVLPLPRRARHRNGAALAGAAILAAGALVVAVTLAATGSPSAVPQPPAATGPPSAPEPVPSSAGPSPAAAPVAQQPPSRDASPGAGAGNGGRGAKGKGKGKGKGRGGD